jgi:hypothetical protein
MDSYRLQRTHNGSIALERGTVPLTPMESHSTQSTTPAEQEPLSQIFSTVHFFSTKW